MSGAEISQDGSTLTVRVPLTFRKRGGRKLVIVPNGSIPGHRRGCASTTPWSRRLVGRSGGGSRSKPARTQPSRTAVEKINSSYVGRVLRLTLLSSEIVEAILDGRQPADLQLEDLLRPLPVVGWREQRAEIWGPYP